MYAANFSDADADYDIGDVRQTGRVVDRMGGAMPFLATASFPCVDLSLAGHWRGLDGDHSSTFFGFTDVLHKLDLRKPRLVMLENVAGLLTSNNGNDFVRVITELSLCDYWVDAIVLDARHFVPQSRPRLFIFGFRSDIKDSIAAFQPEPELFECSVHSEHTPLRPDRLMRLLHGASLKTGVIRQRLPLPPPFLNGLQNVIDLDDGQDWWGDAAVRKHFEMMEPPSYARVTNALASKTLSVGAAFRRTRRGATRLEVRFDVAGCLRTPKGGSAKQIVVVIIDGHLRMRWMSPREYARLQGADDFVINVPPLQAMFGFGDAVCVPAIQWIDDHILTPSYDAFAAKFKEARNPGDDSDRSETVEQEQSPLSLFADGES